MTLILHGSPNSPPTRTVLAFLRFTNLPFEYKLVSLVKGDNRTPEFLKLNPLHTIPVLQEDDFALNESEAIIFYLMDTRGVGKEYYPEDPKTRAQINQYLPYHHRELRPKLAKLFILVWFPQILKCSKDKIRSEALETLKQFEEVFLGNGKKYIVGDVFTIADIFAVNELAQIYYTVDLDFNEFPVMKEYAERCLKNKVLEDVNREMKGFPDEMKKLKEKQTAAAAAKKEEREKERRF